MITSTRLMRGLLASAAAIALTSFTGASMASAETAVSSEPLTYTSAGDGLTGVIPDSAGTRYPAMSYLLDSDGQAVTAFCVQFATPINESAKFTPASYASSGINNMAKVADIAARHNQIGTPYSDARWEAAATQAAIWTLTDGIDASAAGNAAFTARVNALLSGATAMTEPEYTLSLSSTTTVTDLGLMRLKVTVTDKVGPVSGKSVKAVTDDASFTALTDATGVATLDLPAKFAGAAVTVKVQSAVGAGVFLAPSTGQALVTASAAPVFTTQQLTLPAAAAVAAQPTPAASTVVIPGATPSASPTQAAHALAEPTVDVETPPVVTTSVTQDVPDAQVAVTAKSPKELPHTGTALTPAMIVALLGLALLGLAGYALSRHKRA